MALLLDFSVGLGVGGGGVGWWGGGVGGGGGFTQLPSFHCPLTRFVKNSQKYIADPTLVLPQIEYWVSSFFYGNPARKTFELDGISDKTECQNPMLGDRDIPFPSYAVTIVYARSIILDC